MVWVNPGRPPAGRGRQQDSYVPGVIHPVFPGVIPPVVMTGREPRQGSFPVLRSLGVLGGVVVWVRLPGVVQIRVPGLGVARIQPGVCVHWWSCLHAGASLS
jgi:hypothetical protein